jgi:tetratricopeptide (TPR) repeat protein
MWARSFSGAFLRWRRPDATVKDLTLTVRKLAFLGFAYFMNGDYEQAEAILIRWREKFRIKNELNFLFLAAIYAMLGRTQDAATSAGMVPKLNPDFHLSGWRWILAYKSQKDRRHLYDAARKAGVPEHARSR